MCSQNLLDLLSAKLYTEGVTKERTTKPITVAEAGRRGGLARAAKHSKKQLSAWAKKGGRPPLEKAEKAQKLRFLNKGSKAAKKCRR